MPTGLNTAFLRRERGWCVVAFVAYVALIAACEFRHEPWRDEADPWLLARDASVSTFFHRMGLSGTPGLWHLMLVPLARLGLPYGSQAVLHVAIAACVAAIVLWKSPFPLLMRIALVFSYYFAYEYAVVVRSYALSSLLLFSLAATYKQRYERPVMWGILVALLANTNTHSLMIAAVIGLAYVIERVTIGAAIMIAGGVAAAIQVYPPPDSIVQGLIMRFTPYAVPMALHDAFFPRIPIRALWIAGAALALLVAYSVRHSRAALMILLGSYAGLFYVFTYKWIGGLRHSGFLLLIAVFVLWISANDSDRRIVHAALGLSLAVSMISAAAVWRMDMLYAFSGSREMADFIVNSHLDQVPIAAHSETTTSAICPWLREPLWYAGEERLGTYNMWDRRFEHGQEVSYPAAVAAAKRFFGAKRYVLLLNVEMPDPASSGFRLLFTNREPIFEKTDEHFWLYAPLQ